MAFPPLLSPVLLANAPEALRVRPPRPVQPANSLAQLQHELTTQDKLQVATGNPLRMTGEFPGWIEPAGVPQPLAALQENFAVAAPDPSDNPDDLRGQLLAAQADPEKASRFIARQCGLMSGTFSRGTSPKTRTTPRRLWNAWPMASRLKARAC